MKIKSISIKNYKAIAGTLNLDFTDSNSNPLDIIVLTGPNGCGKTSVLEACMIVLNRGYLIDQAKTRISIHDGENQCELTSLIVENGNEVQFERFISKIDDHHYDVSFNFGTGRRRVRYSDDNSKIELPTNFIFDGRPPSISQAPGFAFFSSWRWSNLVGSLSISTKGHRAVNEYLQDGILTKVKQYLINAKARKAFDDSKSVQVSVYDEILGILNGSWRLFYPNGHYKFNVKPAGSDVDEGFEVFYESEDGNTGIPVDKMSSGEIEIFTLLGWFAIHDFSDGMIFIDEPELHLHPAWQRRILEAIQTVAPGAQIIAATHSPLVLSSVEPQCIKIIEHPDTVKENEQFERSAPSPDASYGLDANRILNSMNVDERPPEILSKFSELFDLIDRNKLDQAKLILTDLYDKIHIHDDPDLVFADTLIRRKEIIGK